MRSTCWGTGIKNPDLNCARNKQQKQKSTNSYLIAVSNKCERKRTVSIGLRRWIWPGNQEKAVPCQLCHWLTAWAQATASPLHAVPIAWKDRASVPSDTCSEAGRWKQLLLCQTASQNLSVRPFIFIFFEKFLSLQVYGRFNKTQGLSCVCLEQKHWYTTGELEYLS